MSDAIDHRALAEEIADMHARPHKRETAEADLLYGILCGLLAIHDALTPRLQLRQPSPEEAAELAKQFDEAIRARGAKAHFLPPDGPS